MASQVGERCFWKEFFQVFAFMLWFSSAVLATLVCHDFPCLPDFWSMVRWFAEVPVLRGQVVLWAFHCSLTVLFWSFLFFQFLADLGKEGGF